MLVVVVVLPQGTLVPKKVYLDVAEKGVPQSAGVGFLLT